MDHTRVRVLVVDDEPDILRILTGVLTQAGFKVVVGYGGANALQRLASQPVDIVVTDLAMPGVSGPELIRIIREDPETSDLPILGVTAYVWDDIAQAASRFGCNAFLSKPFSGAELVQAVRKCLEGGSLSHTRAA